MKTDVNDIGRVIALGTGEPIFCSLLGILILNFMESVFFFFKCFTHVQDNLHLRQQWIPDFYLFKGLGVDWGSVKADAP